MSDTLFTINRGALEVTTERVFETTRERLWQAYTDERELPKWWGPAIYRMTIDRMDVRVGGQWRFIHTDSKGSMHAFHGEYQELVKPEKIVDTFEYEPLPGHVLVETTTFEEAGEGQTKLTTTAKYANLFDLEGMVGMGMEGGQRESMERLATLIKKK